MIDPWRRPGFTIPGYASAAARKGHDLKLCRQWTEDEAREQGRKGGRPRRDPQESTDGLRRPNLG